MAMKIAIVGAGPAGCALARLLQQSDEAIEVVIFEGEDSIDFRSQGGTLDLHTKTGQATLKAAGLFAEFEKHARYDGEAINICDKNMLSYIKQGASKSGSTTGRPEIDRPKLRELLYESLEEDTVRWSHKVTTVDPDLTMHFANGRRESGFDLIVGADGAWSHVRPLVSDVKPFYSGIGGHAFRIPDAEKTHPELYALANRGSLFSFSDSKSIMAQYMGDGSLSISTWSVRAADWQLQYGVHDSNAVKEACRKEYADWDLRLLSFTQEAEGNIIPRDLYMLPIGHRWDHVKGVTLIGDAAHLMTPFAFEDSLKLSQAITAAAGDKSTLDRNVASFEADMFKRATATQQLTYDMMHAMFFVPGAPRNGIEEYICRAIEGEMGYRMTRWLIRPIVYAYFFIFKLIW